MTTNEIFKKMTDWILAKYPGSYYATIARKAGLTESTVSRIRNDKVKNTSEETLRKVNAAYGNVFNPEWMRGESDIMLAADLAPVAKQDENALQDLTPAAQPDFSSMMNAVIAAKDETIASKDETIAAQKRELAAKDTLIANLQQQLSDLRTQLAVEKGLLTGASPSAPAEPRPRPGKNA